MYQSVINKYSSYKTVSWTTQQNDFVNFYEATYPRWNYDNCDKKGHHATDFKKFADKLATIDAMAFGISICQYIVLTFSIIFFIVTCVLTNCGKTKTIPPCLHICLLIKLITTILLNIICFILIIILMATSMSIKKKDVDFLADTICVSDAVTYQIYLFEPFYKSVVTNVIIVFLACFLQNVYEALIYPSIRFKWIGRFVTFHDGEGPEHAPLPEAP